MYQTEKYFTCNRIQHHLPEFQWFFRQIVWWFLSMLYCKYGNSLRGIYWQIKKYVVVLSKSPYIYDFIVNPSSTYSRNMDSSILAIAQKYGFCIKSFRKDEPLTSWSLLQYICPHFWAWLLLYSAITPVRTNML